MASILAEAKTLEIYFDTVLNRMDAEGETIERNSIVQAVTATDLYSELRSPERDQVIVQEARTAMLILQRARLFRLTSTPYFTTSLRLTARRDTCTATSLGRRLRRRLLVRHAYLLARCTLERILRLKQKWAWLLAFGQTIAWAIRFWGDHAAAFDRETVMITALVGVVISAAIGWLCSLLD